MTRISRLNPPARRATCTLCGRFVARKFRTGGLKIHEKFLCKTCLEQIQWYLETGETGGGLEEA